jgi:hypothetical protein
MKIKVLWYVTKTLLGLPDPEDEGLRSLHNVNNME